MEDKGQLELHLPGLWIDHPNRSFAFLLHNILGEIIDQLFDAKMTLELFNNIKTLPLEMTMKEIRLRQIYGKSFVYALDTVCQLIRILYDQELLHDSARDQCKIFFEQFWCVRDLRNSLHHIEDRIRGIGLNGKNIPCNLIYNGAFIGNSFGATSANGHYVSIEISICVWSKAYSIVEDLIWCFEWVSAGNIKISRPTGIPT